MINNADMHYLQLLSQSFPNIAEAATEIINLQNELSIASNRRDIGKTFEVLIEGTSKRSSEQLCGRTSQNKMVVFTAAEGLKAGDYATVKIHDCSSATLFGELV